MDSETRNKSNCNASANELAGARYQGRVIAETAAKLHG